MLTRIATAGAAFSLVFATCEAYGVATGDPLPQPLRVWMVGLTISLVIVAATQIILDRLDSIRASSTAVQRADRDFEDTKKRLRNDGDVTYLYPEE